MSFVRRKKFCKGRKENLHSLNRKSTVLVKQICLDEGVAGTVIRTYIPKSSIDKKAKKQKDHSLIPSKRAIVLPTYHAYPTYITHIQHITR